MTFKYFNETDDPLIVGLSDQLLLMLDSARGIAGKPFLITSGKRSPEENSVLKGAVADSSHLTGLAVDLHVEDQFHLFAMVKGLQEAGFLRIGLYYAPAPDNPSNLLPKHIHVDIDPDKPQDIIFTKVEQN